MQKFIFDVYGHLISDKLIETNLEEIRTYFVEPFSKSETRKNLFTLLEHYLRASLKTNIAYNSLIINKLQAYKF